MGLGAAPAAGAPGWGGGGEADRVNMLERLVLLRERLGFFPVVDAVSSSERSMSVELPRSCSGVPGRAGFMSTVEARRMTPPMREVHFLGVVVAMKAEMEIESVVGVVKSVQRGVVVGGWRGTLLFI